MELLVLKCANLACNALQKCAPMYTFTSLTYLVQPQSSPKTKEINKALTKDITGEV